MVAALLAVLLCAAPAVALAAPGDPGEPPATTTPSAAPRTEDAPAPSTPGDTDTDPGNLRIGLDYLGASPTLDLPGLNYTFALTLAVPDGTRPTALFGRVSLPAYLSGGAIDVLQGERVLSRTQIGNEPGAEVRLPLTGVVVDDSTHSVTFALRSYLRTTGFCEFDPADTFRLTSASLSFAGTPAAPTTVSDFLPPVLTQISLYVPADPTANEGAAAVSLATSIVNQYQSAPIGVATRALPRNSLTPPVDRDPTHRQIVIAENLTGGITLSDGGRYLVLGGSELHTEAAFLASAMSRLAMSSAAIPGPEKSAPQLARDVATLADIGVGDQHVTTIGWPTLAIGIDQARIGRPVHNIRVQLQGTYTPPPTGTGGRVVVRAGETVIDSWPVEAAGTFDRWVDVPNELVGRYTELRVTVERGDTRTACGDGYRSSLSLSSGGLLQTEPADPPIPPGFGSLPQSVMPRTQLAWTRGDFSDVNRGVILMTGLQRLSATPLGVDLVAMDQLNNKLPAVLIAADGTGLPALPLPVTGDDKGRIEVNIDGHAEVTNLPSVPFGSLQVLRDNNRTVLVATSTRSPALLDDALTWLNSDARRWAAMHGVAMIQAAKAPPVFIDGPKVTVSSASTISVGGWIGIVIATLAAVAAALFLLRLRHRRRQ